MIGSLCVGIVQQSDSNDTVGGLVWHLGSCQDSTSKSRIYVTTIGVVAVILVYR